MYFKSILNIRNTFIVFLIIAILCSVASVSAADPQMNNETFTKLTFDNLTVILYESTPQQLDDIVKCNITVTNAVDPVVTVDDDWFELRLYDEWVKAYIKSTSTAIANGTANAGIDTSDSIIISKDIMIPDWEEILIRPHFEDFDIYEEYEMNPDHHDDPFDDFGFPGIHNNGVHYGIKFMIDAVRDFINVLFGDDEVSATEALREFFKTV